MTEPLRVTFDDGIPAPPPGGRPRRTRAVIAMLSVLLLGAGAITYAVTRENAAPVTAPLTPDTAPITDPPTEPPPPPTEPETSPLTNAAPTSHRFEVGDTFSAQCTIAWPTAPAIGTDSIQMRTSCPSVSNEYLFVDVIYGDPKLRVTPNRSTMQIHGKVIDIVRNGLGFTTLAVEATRITLL